MEDFYGHCMLCPRRCGVDRHSGRGFCGGGACAQVVRAAPHFWEEPCISGSRGSGAVFFSGCNLRCAFCQNMEISHTVTGKSVDGQALADIFQRLYAQNVHNLNLVTGTLYIPTILEALTLYMPPVPVLWNTGGYERVEALRMLEGKVNIFLPDLKHVSSRLSGLCAAAPDYFEYASAALMEMKRQVGDNQYDEDGILQRGMIVRHLILPGCTGDAIRVLRFMAEKLPGVPVSIMRQYTPSPFCSIPGLNRRITDEEYGRVVDAARALGVPGFIQEKESATFAYTPAFDLTGVAREEGEE